MSERESLTMTGITSLTPALEIVRERTTRADYPDLPLETREPYLTLLEAADAVPEMGKAGTMKAWMSAHHGMKLHTLQADLNGRNPWLPIRRTVDAKTRATAVLIAGSTREYAGCRVVAASDDALLIETPHQVALYVVAKA